jgi:hypothetical protein
MNSTAEKHDEARPDVDGLLHGYFQAEKPHPWPRFRAPVTLRVKQPASGWSRYTGRLVMAACVALLVGGYIALSGYFPRPVADNGTTPLHEIGQKEKGSHGKRAVEPIPEK